LREFNMVYTQVEDAVVHRDWIRRTTDGRAPPTSLDTPWRPMHYPDAIPRDAFDEVIVGHDPAGKGRDRFAFVTVGQVTHMPEDLPESLRHIALTEDGDHEPVHIRHILDVWQAADVPPSRWRSKLEALYDRYHPDEIAIESNLNATWTADDDAMPRRVKQAIAPVPTTRSKHSWKDGVPSIGSDIETGRYRFYDDGADDCRTEELVTALTSIQMAEGELQGHTPDLVMALYMTHKRLSSGHISSSSTDMRYGRDEDGKRRERNDRDKRRELKDSEVGQAILNRRDDMF
jgi:YD repeat-containing protein